MGAVQLDAIVACLVEVLGGVGEAIGDTLNLFGRGGVWLLEGHAHDVPLELNVAGRNRVLLDAGLDLPARVRDLTNDQAAVLLAGRGEVGKGVEALAGEGGSAGDDGIASSFELVIFDHDVAGQDGAEVAFTPSLVDIDKVRGRNAPSFEVLGVP